MNSRESMVDYIVAADQFEKEKQYWLNKLQGELVKTHFPYDYPLNNNEQLQQEHQHMDFRFTREIDSRLLSIANNSEIRLFMLLVAGLVVLLHKYTGKKDIMIGSPILKQEVHGDFVNTMLILRHRLEDKTNFKELMYIVKQTLVEASKNQNYPIKSLTRELDLDPVVPGDGNPFFDCMILLENIHDKSYIPESSPGMIFSFAVDQQTLHGCIGYNAALYDERTIKRISHHYRHLFQHILFNSELPLVEMPILSEDEKKQLLVEFNNNHRIPASFNTIVDWFEDQVEKTPGNIAAVYEDQEIDYMKLNQKANQLARALIRNGLHRDTITALMFTSSLEMIVSILAVLKTGGAYLPISAELPETRIKYIIQDCRTKHVVISKNLTEIQPFFAKNLFNGEIFIVDNHIEDIYHDEDNSNIGIKYEANALAYVIYTSGTTGLPKGVLIEHKGIFNYINWRYHAYGCSEKDVTLQLLSYSFDGFMSNFYSSLLSGGTLVMVPDLKMLDFNYIIGLIKDKGVTNTSIVPRIFDIILQYAQEEDLKSLRFVILAGEKAEERLVEKIKEKNADIILVNEYGPTEASVTAAANKNMDKSPTSVVGKPIANTKIFIFNGTFDIVPIGVPGELCIAGPGVARGYLNHPGLTREKFPGDPFEKGTVIYRTGDWARWLPDGNIEFKGRVDFQVKVRGFRIELGEIEGHLLNHDDITGCVVAAADDGHGDKYLCAYLVSQKELTVHELREYLSNYLSDYMIPAYFVLLEKMPLSPNGKVDRKQLPTPAASRATGQYTPPRDRLENQLVEIWAQVLDIEKDTIGIDANFFELGGHSLTATLMSNRINKDLNVKVPMVEIFKAPRIRNLAEYIKAAKEESFASIGLAEEKEYYALSSAQYRFYILQQMDTGATAYNLPLVVELEGETGKKAVEDAFRRLIQRHESLRTSFNIIEESPSQRIHKPSAIEFKIDYHNLAGERREEKIGNEVEAIISKFVKPFDLSRAPLLRVGLIKIAPSRYILMVDMHHILTDIVAYDILTNDFLSLYNGRELPPLRLQYKDYSQWQRGKAGENALKQQEKYWVKQFPGEIPVLNLPTDFTRPVVQSFEGSSVSFELSREETTAFYQFFRSQQLTLFMAVLGIFNIFLSKICNQEEIVVGTPIVGRKHADLEKIIGVFLNMLALRNHLEGEITSGEFLKELKERTLEALENQNYHYEDLVEQVEVERDTGRNPLFDVVFALKNLSSQEGEITGKEMEELKIKPHPTNIKTSKFDLSLFAFEERDKLYFSFEYCTRLFREETIARFINYFLRIMRSAANAPGNKIAEIEIISGEEKNQLLFDFNDTEADYPKNKTIHRLFEEQAARTPDYTAVHGCMDAWMHEGGHMTYRELNATSNQLAYLLKEKGLEPDAIVGIMMERTVEMIIGILSILKSGGAYLPIDPDYPEERKQYMLKDSSARILVSKVSKVSEVSEESEKTGVNRINWLEDLNKISKPGEGIELILIDKGMEYFTALASQHTQQTTTPPTHHRLPTKRPTLTHPTHLCYIIYTSGTTGKPKGVMIEHRNVVRLMFNNKFQFHFSSHDVWTMFHSYCFDFSVWEMYGALLYGGKLTIIPKMTARDPAGYLAILKKDRVTVLNQIPSAFYSLITEELKFPGKELYLRYIIFGGEALVPVQLKKWKEKYPETLLINMYGITETTIHVTFKKIGKKEIESNLSIVGKPIPTLTTYIMDKHLKLVPIGVAGEICVGGKGGGRGYLNQQELTKEKFAGNPYKPGERLYKSGDLGRLLTNGDIQYLGRIDHQVKIRGFRIELGEIEKRLANHHEIKEAVIICREDEKEDKYLIAYIVSDKKLAATQLREYLTGKLPDFMIPSYFVQVERLPRTLSGKLDRKTLPGPEPGVGREYAAPRDKVEEKLAAIWSEILRIDQSSISIDDNFFVLGGHSLKANLMITRIHKELQFKLPLSEVFKTPTIKKLAETLKCLAEDRFTAVGPAEEKEYYALSPAQKRLYFLQRIDTGGITYNLPNIWLLEEEIHEKKLAEAAMKMIARHESLRTSFEIIAGGAVQRIYDDAELEIGHVEIEDKTELEKIIRDFVRPFDLGRVPLLRISLVNINGTGGSHKQRILLFDMHHIISDGISHGILIREFMRLYAGNDLPLLRLQYRDYSEWRHRQAVQGVFKPQQGFWIQQFAGKIPLVNLPCDYPRPAVQSFEGSVFMFALEEEETKALNEITRTRGVTLFMVLLAAYNVLLLKLSRQEDIVVGSPVACRRHTDLQQIIGMFVNMLTLRNNPSGEKTFADFLEEVRENTLEAFENQEYPFEDLVEKVDITRDLSRNPLFDAGFILQNMYDPPAGTSTPLKSIGYKGKVSRFDLSLIVYEAAGKLDLTFEYCTRLFKEETIARFTGYFKKIISSVIENPGVKIQGIDILTEEEKNRVLYELNQTAADYPREKTIHELFRQQAVEVGDRIALTGIGNFALSYRELNEQSRRLACLLIEKGVKSDTIVAIMTEPSPAMITGILGILKAGAAYLPIEPGYPPERIQYMLKDSRAKALITTGNLAEDVEKLRRLEVKGSLETIFIDTIDASNPSSSQLLNFSTSPSSLAYIIYTSGTTGEPKGVLIEHRNVVQLFFNDKFQFDFGRDDTWTLFHSFCFDFSVWEMYGALLYGGRLVVISRVMARDTRGLPGLLRGEGATVLNQTPSAFYRLMEVELEQEKNDLCLRYVIFGGEALNPGRLKKWRDRYPGTRLVNMFGITETTVHVTCKEITAKEIEAGASNIGRPIPTLAAYILDENLRPVPVGVPGELCVGGRGLARGYLNRPGLTAEKFYASMQSCNHAIMQHHSPSPHHPDTPKLHSPIYRSGDMARLLSEGDIEYLGRIDQQVKLRGYRIEPGEIESKLLTHPDIKAAVVILNGAGLEQEQKYLCAYFVSDKDMAIPQLRTHLSRTLPGYMVPSYFIQLEKIPLTGQGKLDRRALPAPEPSLIKLGTTYVAPESSLEKAIVGIWQEVLKIDKVGIHDNFFDLGGNSFNIIALHTRLKTLTGKDIPLVDLFTYPTIDSFLKFLGRKEGKGESIAVSKEKTEESVMMMEETMQMLMGDTDE